MDIGDIEGGVWCHGAYICWLAGRMIAPYGLAYSKFAYHIGNRIYIVMVGS